MFTDSGAGLVLSSYMVRFSRSIEQRKQINFIVVKLTVWVWCGVAIYYIKLKSRPSVRSFLDAWISAVDARIDVKLARNEAPVFWDYEVYF